MSRILNKYWLIFIHLYKWRTFLVAKQEKEINSFCQLFRKSLNQLFYNSTQERDNGKANFSILCCPLS